MSAEANSEDTSTEETDRTRDHGWTSGPGIAGDASSFPSDAEFARTLLEAEKRAVLSTLTSSGHPFGSTVSYSIDAGGRPVILVSEMAEHTQNARGDARVSLLVAEPIEEGQDPLSAARMTLVGSMVQIDAEGLTREVYLERHPGAAYYVDFPDFSFWAIEVESCRFVGGFGHMSWVQGPDFSTAAPDPVGPVADGIVEHMNEDHGEANLMYAHVLAGLPEATGATMSGVDRYGVTLDVVLADGNRTARVAFPEALNSADEVRPAVIELLTKARSLSS